MQNTGLIDLYKTNDLFSGLGQFSFHLGTQLMQSHSDIPLHFLLPGSEVAGLFRAKAPHRFTFANFQKRYLPALNPAYTFWHSTQQFPSFMPHKRSLQILTIHDLNFLSSKTQNKARSYMKKLQENIDRSEIITTISNFTRTEIEKHLNLKNKTISVIYNGIPDPCAQTQLRPAWLGDAPFFFSVGVFKATKNFHSLLPLMQYFPDFQLVIAGNNNSVYGREIIEYIAQNELKDKVFLPGIVSEAEKNWLYANCSAFVFPSLAEGFGMPLAEAMKAGCPVFSSKLSSLPEIGGDSVYYFESFAADDMKDTILAGLDDFNKNSTARKAAMAAQAYQFNWHNCATSYAAIYRAILT